VSVKKRRVFQAVKDDGRRDYDAGRYRNVARDTRCSPAFKAGLSSLKESSSLTQNQGDAP